MEEKLGMRYMVRILFTAIGTYGIVRVLTSCALFGVSDARLLFGIGIYSVLCVVGIYTKKWVKKFLITAGIVFGTLAVLCVDILRSGMRHIYNDCMYALEKAYQLDLGRLPVSDTSGKIMKENITMLFLAFLITLAVTFVVVYLHSMLGALLSVLPMMILFVSMASIPDSLSFFLCIVYVFGVSALHGQEGGERQSLAVLVICTVAVMITVILMPPNHFQRLPVFETLNKAASEHFSWVGGGFSAYDMAAVANGGINRGELGKIKGIRYTNETVLTLTTSDIDKNQYFSSFIGQTYENNQWLEPMSVALKEDCKEQLVDVMDADGTLQAYIDGGRGDYYNIVKKFPYTLEYVNGDTKTGMYVSADVTGYSIFQNISEYIDSQYNETDKIKYHIEHTEYQNRVYDSYLGVPENVADIVNGLMGNVTVTTQEQKEYYIKYVKDYLAANYTYNLMPGKVPEGEDFVKYFLLESREGYCTYFATAAVMMYRCAGIPARYVEGYVVTDNAISQGRTYHTLLSRYAEGGIKTERENTNYVLEVQDNAAHAWAEVYMDGYGWVTVEVTPPAGAAGTAQQTGNGQPVSVAGQETPEETAQESTQETHTDAAEKTQAEEGTSETVADSKDIQNLPEAQNADVQGSEENEKVDRLGTLFTNPLFFIPCIIVFFVMGVFLLIFARYFIIRQIRMGKERTCSLKTMEQKQLCQMILSEYQSLEKVIAFAGFGQTNGLEYEAYAGYLTEASDIFRNNQMKAIMELVLRISFSGVPVSESEYRAFRKNVRKIRQEIYREQGAFRKFYFKYIKMY